jgi:8-oxo-dGTP pyrophosphatase MutT (NUDIX family)
MEEIEKLEVLTKEAQEVFFKKESDGFSFADFMGTELIGLASAREGRAFDVSDLKKRVDYDLSAPESGKTVCAVCLAESVIDEAEKRYADNEKISCLISLFKELEEAEKERMAKLKFSKILEINNKIKETMRLWTQEELQDIQNKFLEIKREFLNKSSNDLEMIPRYHVGIYKRSNDEHLLGSEIELHDKRLLIGSFVMTRVDERNCFSKLAFVLGLGSGCHILAGCGSLANHSSHLYELRNFRLKFRKEAYRANPVVAIFCWDLLPAQIYKEALERKEYFEKSEEFGSMGKRALSIVDLWCNAKEFKPKITEKIWIEGKELEAKLWNEPDRSFSHTVRAVAVRKNIITGEWEVFLVTEYGDRKSGGKTTVKTGKPSGIGCPGGLLEPNETLGRTLIREAENESGFGNVVRIIACVGEVKKMRLPGKNKDNIDHWFLIETDSEYFLSRQIIENKEIYKARWVPLSELASFKFQNRNNPIWNVQTIEEKKIMYLNHAVHLSEILPRVPEIELPFNFGEFQENIRKFIKDSR